VGGPSRRPRVPRSFLLGAVLLPTALLLFSCSGCSPVYVARAGWEELKILSARKPLEQVIGDPATDEDTRHKLLLVQQARAFAIHFLELDAGDSYTTFTRLKTDTLALVLSAAYPDRLQSKTWWFPIVGHVPYRGFFSLSAAEKAQRSLEREGLDTYLRPTAAFSTLGFFSDPLLSTLLRYDSVDLVETVIHELAHNHLFVPSQVQFNESFATFVGRVGAVHFFCGPGPTPSNPQECQLARERWAIYQEFSTFLDAFVEELQAVYRRSDLTAGEKVTAREELFAATRNAHLVDGALRPGANPLVTGFLGRPLNNAVLLARMRYFHRLPDFQALLERHGEDVPAAIAFLKENVDRADDAFDILPRGG
jgi:predicted aminopeptidase